MVSFNDDEPVPVTEEVPAEPEPSSSIKEKIKLEVIHKGNVSDKATDFTVLLELNCNGSEEDSPGLDIVTTLDVSGSMIADEKLQKMKRAMRFLIKKLSPFHRLSVVTFSTMAERKCNLRSMTPEAQEEIASLVDGLEARGNTNIAGGLRMALKVLQERKLSDGRLAAIMLMSDGDQGSRYEDARDVLVHDVPVFTFGFGKGNDYNPEVLNVVARNSKGGTFSVADVLNTESNNLSIAFAQCLAGLLSVVVQNLRLTITKAKSEVEIKNVLAGNYPITGDANAKTITFGELYNQEERKVLVDLALPPAGTSKNDYKCLDITCSCVYRGKAVEAHLNSVKVERTEAAVDEEKEEVRNEKKCVDILRMMKAGTELADEGNYGEAQNELRHAQYLLDAVNNNASLTEGLKYEMNQLLEMMESAQIYTSKGRHFALATLTSHARQRHAARGDDPTNPTLFATPAMAALVQQAIDFERNPNEQPPLD